MVGKTVKQIGGIDNLIGRVGTVVDSFQDENGNTQCLCESLVFDHSTKDTVYSFWCPSNLLEEV